MMQAMRSEIEVLRHERATMLETIRTMSVNHPKPPLPPPPMPRKPSIRKPEPQPEARLSDQSEMEEHVPPDEQRTMPRHKNL